jgi:isopenicillin N synthase-like dioxygenase
MPDANAIPVIDLGPYLAGEPGALDRAAAELRHALTEIGFYTIVNHGVPSALVHEVYYQVTRFQKADSHRATSQYLIDDMERGVRMPNDNPLSNQRCAAFFWPDADSGGF